MNTNIKKILIITSGVLLFIIRLTGDIILFSINKDLILSQNSIWNLTTSILIIGLSIFYYYEDSKNDFNIKYEDIIQFFNYSFSQASFLTVTIFVIYLVIDSVLQSDKLSGDYFILIIKTFLYLYLIIVAILNLGFSIKWIWSRRKKNTKEMLLILGIASSVLMILYTLNFKEFTNTTFQTIAIIIIITFIIGIAYYTPIKNNWIATLDKKMKIKFLFLSLINTLIGVIILVNTFSQSSMMFKELNHFFSVASTFFTISFIIYTILNVKLLINVLNMLPSTTLFAKKHQEINNLAFLIKYIAESINKENDYILSTVTELAIKTSGANGGWVELYDDEYKISFCNNISKEKIINLYDKKLTIDLFKNHNQVHLVESLSEDSNYSHILNHSSDIKSIIIIPVFSFEKRLGTIVIFKNEEYALEQDDVQVMNAFGDNVRIALENSQLMKESIEKEKYKNEMLLAQQMQNKLLPQVLPFINGFTTSAISLPAAVVGGDYYDVVTLKNGKFCVIIGDVSGKGISASFYMAQLKGIVLAKSKDASSAKELLSGINEVIYKNVESKMFITISVIVFDDFEGNVTLARAGHLPFIVRNNGKVELIKPSGIGVGLTDNHTFDKYLEEQSLKLNQDSAVILITDGVNELNTYNKKEFGFEPLIELLKDEKIKEADDFIRILENQLREFINHDENHDDMTIFAIYKNV